MAQTNSNVTIVIPAYNEEKTIRTVAEKVLQHNLPLVVIDDCSTDKTSEQLSGLNLTLIRNKENMGKSACLGKGFQAALDNGSQAVITLDGDGQHAAEDIPKFLEAWEKNSRKIIIGSRLANKADIPPARYYANRFANFWVSWAAGFPIKDSQSGFRLYPAELLKSIKVKVSKGRAFTLESEILIEAGRKGYRVAYIPIKAVYPEDRRASHFKPLLDIGKITLMIAWKLFIKGGYFQGLYRSLTDKQ